MGFTIEDGTGKGYQVRVTEDNMLTVHSVNTSSAHHANHSHGHSYNLIFSQTASGPNDCILYLKNSNDVDMILNSITTNAPTDEIIEIKLNDVGTPVGGSDIIPVNVNAGSNNQASGVFQGGNDITGLTGGYVTGRYFIKGGESSKEYKFNQDIIVPKNRIFALYCVNGSILVNGFLSFYFHEVV